MLIWCNLVFATAAQAATRMQEITYNWIDKHKYGDSPRPVTLLV